MNSVLPGQMIAVWFSCGAASAVAAKKTIEKYGKDCFIRVINNPIIEEHPDNQRFLKDVEKWIGVKIEFAINKNYPTCSIKDVFEKRQYVSGPQGAPCTVELKKIARRQWEENNKCDWIVLGFTYEEKSRHERFIVNERDNLIPILIELGITKKNCFQIIKSAGIALPKIYELGYPNANCIGCVKASSATYWNLVRKTFPDIFKDRAEQSRRIGAKLVWFNKKRMFLDELPEHANGRPIKNMNIECGIFCEEKP